MSNEHWRERNPGGLWNLCSLIKDHEFPSLVPIRQEPKLPGASDSDDSG